VSVVRVTVVIGDSCHRCQLYGCQLHGWQLSWVAVVLGGNIPRWQLSRPWELPDGSCLGGCNPRISVQNLVMLWRRFTVSPKLG